VIHRRFVQEISKKSIVGVGVMLLASACSTTETFDSISGPLSFETTGSVSMLSQSELATYVADHSYMQSLAPVDRSVNINHADPRQHRFVLARLKMAGKTPETAPQLFEAMEKLRTAQIAQKLGPGVMVTTPGAAGTWQSLHLSGPEGIARNGKSSNDVMGSAIATRKDQLNYGYVDSTVWDGLGNQLGDLAYFEIFGSMPSKQIVASGSRLFANDDKIQSDSTMMEIVTATGEMRSSYLLNPKISMNATPGLVQGESSFQASGTLNAIANPPTIEHPIQIPSIAGPIKVCLERGGADCTYFNGSSETGQDLTWKVRVPLKGSVTIANTTHVFDTNKINQFKAGTATTTTQIILGYSQAGGGCLNGGNVTQPTAIAFWNSVSLSADKKTLTWDMASNLLNWAKFSESCQLFNTPTYVTMYLGMPAINITTAFTTNIPVWVSNQPGYDCSSNATPTSVCVAYTPDMLIVNSCLAEGTNITTNGTNARKIEDLRLGDQVSNPYATNLTIVDTIVGTEITPMVRIADDNGHDLLLTEMHPLYVEGRGMVPAKLLRVGDPVRTDKGPSRLARVTREDYRGKVYNLKLGSHDEAMKLGVDQTAMYANGFLVGDAQIQDRYQTMETEQRYPTKSDGKLSSRWRKDYQQSLSRAASATGAH